MDTMLEKKKSFRKWIILVILYILSGSVYITLLSGSQWLAAFGIILMIPEILSATNRNVSHEAFFRGLFIYGFVVFVIGKGVITQDSMGSYFRVALIFLFAYYFTQEFSFFKFRKIFTKFVSVMCLIDTVIYFILQKVGQFSFLPIAYNSNGEGYRIGILFNYLLSHPERNAGIYWEPGLFATMIVLSFILDLLFEEQLLPWRIFIYHVCILTTASSAGIVLILFCDLILLNRFISTFSNNRAVKYCIFFIVYAVLLFLFLNLDAFLTATGLAEQRVYAKLLSNNMGSSARMQALVKNWNLFLKNPIGGIGISEAYRLASNFSDTSTTTFMMVEFGIVGFFPTLFVIKSIIGLKTELVEIISTLTVFLCILNKEPHMGIAVVWILALFFSKERESKLLTTDETESIE